MAPYGDQNVLPEKVPSAQTNRSAIWIGVLSGVLAVALCLQFYTLKKARSLSGLVEAERRETAALQERQDKRIRQLSERERSHAEAVSQLKEEVDAASKSLGSTRTELSRARGIASRLEEQQQQQAQLLRGEIATKADEQTVGAVARAASSTKADLDTIQVQIDTLSRDSAAARSELGTVIESQHRQIEQLRKQLPGQIGPIYNAIFEPTVPPTRTHLYDGKRTSIRFFIGPSAAKNAIPAPKSVINQKILKKGGLVPLAVTMTCRPCADDSLQKRAIVYKSDEGVSSEALFAIMPRRAQARKEDGFSQIIFDVSSEGVEYDHVGVDVFIDPPDGTKDAALSRAPSFPARGEGYKPDLVVTFDWSNNRLKVQLEPVDSRITKLCKSGCRDGRGDFHWLDAGSLSTEEIRKSALDTYFDLKTLVEQDNRLLHLISPAADTKLSPNASNLPTNEDLNKILTKFFHLGAQFYRRIFLDDAAPELRAFMKAFGKLSFPDRPIRVKIVAREIYLPWQFLHPPGQMSQDSFWGFRYELVVVNDSNNGRDGRPPDAINYTAGPDSAVFVLYRGEKGEDPTVSDYGNREASFFGEEFGSTGLIRVNSRKSLLDELERKAEAVNLLLAYTHATSGVVLGTLASGGATVYVMEVAGQRILFTKNEFVSVKDFNELRDNLDEDHDRFFPAQPLVLLNACETGVPAQSLPDGYGQSREAPTNLPSTMLRLGARGVIATESPVWAGFAYNFGEDLIKELAQGVDVPRALYDVRRKWLGYKNPLGLLYSYYGAPGVRVVRLNASE